MSEKLLRCRDAPELVPSQRGHECRPAPGRNAGAIFMSEDGVHALRLGAGRCAARLVTAY
jgi:hypothetical protein